MLYNVHNFFCQVIDDEEWIKYYISKYRKLDIKNKEVNQITFKKSIITSKITDDEEDDLTSSDNNIQTSTTKLYTNENYTAINVVQYVNLLEKTINTDNVLEDQSLPTNLQLAQQGTEERDQNNTRKRVLSEEDDTLL